MAEERPWLKNYPVGVPANINPDQYPDLLSLLAETMTKFKGKDAFICMGKALTFEKLDKESRHFAAYLHSRGLEPGDKIALMMPNLLQYPIALFGALRAGLIVVNTNPLYTPREMKHQFVDSGAKAILIVENFAHHLEEIIRETNIKIVLVTSIGELLGAFKGALVNFVIRRIRKMVPKYQLENTVTFKQALKQGRQFSIKAFPSSPEDVIMLQYTGGTTGLAKGAMLTNRNLVSNMLQIRSVMLPFLKEGEESVLSPLPMYHIFAFTVNCLALFSIGSRTILITNARDFPSLIKEWKKYPISLMTGINTLFNALMHQEDFKTIDFSTLKITVGGGMAVQKAVAERWKEVTGCQLSEGYGMTESSPVVSVNPLDGRGRLGSIGLPVPSTDVRIVSEDGIIQGTDHPGEIQVKGPQVMKGYYNKPDETAKILKDDWLSTGDIGIMDADGFFRIVDRKKDMILVSGFNVYPNEIEDVISSYPKVLEVAAIGVDDEKSGEVVKVFIVPKDKSLTKDEVIAFCRENMTGYKVPKYVEFRKELPKTNVGKILRRALKDEEKAKPD
ncbi:MAG: AMP-binding protein [Saprospiraceae bacterium]|nr:AMP-binding protein [Saprospiraceae bacterium]MCB9320821.1 AMP-binding protein [Lewinellaceae bacterium]